jgi:hypothetical protein
MLQSLSILDKTYSLREFFANCSKKVKALYTRYYLAYRAFVCKGGQKLYLGL